jgi:hypothetical protein
VECLAFSGRSHGKMCASFLQAPFFVNAGILFYLYLAGVSVPLLGTNFVETPGISGVRSIVQALLFVIFFYLGFIRKWKEKSIK